MRKKYLTFQTNYVFNQADPDNNRFLPGAPDPNKTNTFNFSQNQPFMSYDIYTDWSYQLNWFLNYKRTFDRHDVDAVFVYEQAENGGYAAMARAENPITAIDQFLPIRKIVLFARRKVGSRTEPDSRISDVLTIISTAGTLLNFHSGMTEIRFFHSTNAGASFLRCRPHGESRKKNSLRESLLASMS